MPFIISNINKWPIVIPDATATVEGVLKLSDIPSHAGTLSTIYDNGTLSPDQTINLSSAKGGPVLFRPFNPSFGTMLLLETSASDEIFRVVDGGFNIRGVNAAGTFIRLDPAFGSPVMGSQTAGGFMSYSGDGNGALWGGTSMTAMQNGVDSALTFALNDVADYEMNKFGLTTPSTKAIGVNPGNGAPVPNNFVATKFFTTTNGGALTIAANTIAPTAYLHSVGAGLLQTITPPFTGFIGTIALVPTAAFTYNNAGNITPPTIGGGLANVGQTMFATYDGSKWTMSY